MQKITTQCPPSLLEKKNILAVSKLPVVNSTKQKNKGTFDIFSIVILIFILLYYREAFVWRLVRQSKKACVEDS